jgi:hypothetical protein
MCNAPHAVSHGHDRVSLMALLTVNLTAAVGDVHRFAREEPRYVHTFAREEPRYVHTFAREEPRYVCKDQDTSMILLGWTRTGAVGAPRPSAYVLHKTCQAPGRAPRWIGVQQINYKHTHRDDNARRQQHSISYGDDSSLRLSTAMECANPARATRSFRRDCSREILSSSALVCPTLSMPMFHVRLCTCISKLTLYWKHHAHDAWCTRSCLFHVRACMWGIYL